MDFNVVKVKEDVIRRNDDTADRLRSRLAEKRVFFLNLMASPGSGKTTLLLSLLPRLAKKYRIGVLEADIDSAVDAETISQKLGLQTLQIHTSGACHLTAQMVEDALSVFDTDNLDLIVLENIGNLVCPAEFDTGANMNLVLLSVPEGDDKPLKYPLMFEVANMVAVTKLDTLEVFDFDFEQFEKNVAKRNSSAQVFKVCSLSGEGIDALESALDKKMSDYFAALKK